MGRVKEQVSISLDTELLKLLKKRKGLVPLSTYINQKLWEVETTGVPLDPELLKRINEKRGDAPLSTYINRMLWERLGERPPEVGVTR